MIKDLKYINIEYTEKDLEYIDEVCNVIDKKSEDIVNFFELKKFNDKVNVKLFNNLEDFRKFYNETYHREPKEWVCGFAKGNNVFTLSLNEYKKCLSHEEATIEDLERLILHEFTHSVHSKRHNNMDVKWISEGAATYLSGQHGDKKEITCTYEELINNAPYHNYKVMFEYVLNTYGKDYILKLIDDEELLKKESKRLFKESKANSLLEKLQYECDEYKLYSPDSLKYITDNMKDILINKIYQYKEFFKLEKIDQLQINYFDDLDKFRKFVSAMRDDDRPLPEYARGTYDNGMVNGHIEPNIIIDSPMYKRKLTNANHELFHILYMKYILKNDESKRIVWYDEGMAQLLSGDFDYLTDEESFNKFYKNVKELTKIIPSFNEIEHGKSFVNDNYNGYHFAYLCIRYLNETLSKEEFQNLMSYFDKIKEYGNTIINDMFNYYDNKNNILFDSEHINYIKMNNKYIDDYLSMYNNKEMQMVLFGKEKEFTKEQIENWITKVLNDNSNTFTMIEKETNDFIGIIEIMNVKDGNGELAISITPNKQNKHYGTEAMNAIIEYGYKNVGLRSIDVNVHKTNPKAIHLYENTGFIQDEEKDESIHMKHNK